MPHQSLGPNQQGLRAMSRRWAGGAVLGREITPEASIFLWAGWALTQEAFGRGSSRTLPRSLPPVVVVVVVIHIIDLLIGRANTLAHDTAIGGRNGHRPHGRAIGGGSVCVL